jgi:hypothetical protein
LSAAWTPSPSQHTAPSALARSVLSTFAFTDFIYFTTFATFNIFTVFTAFTTFTPFSTSPLTIADF